MRFDLTLSGCMRLSKDHDYLDRVYLTNDLVRYTGDGRMVYIGRKEGYIKINGQRIEPAEIESSIASLVTDDTSVCVQEYSNTTEDGQSQYLTCFFTHGGQGSKAVRVTTGRA